ncbi:hypothetical protein GDO78_020824 [Eleutherodactylus coqui]|uniref:Uncharacterized protein n=1 Tax=Eleutherodactylus coqui TaxID=57060 RepID=A0A8J6E5F6_ELECQ|nr:hypothetical protein GDO78_020824 [Eleutherodactylus coqui]
MLALVNYSIPIQVLAYMLLNNLFKDLSRYRSQAHRPVVSWIHLLFLKMGTTFALFAIFWDFCSPGIFTDSSEGFSNYLR